MLKFLKKFVLFITLFILTVYLSVWGLSPYVAQHFLADFLEQNNLQLSESSHVRYNPFLSRLNIENVTITKTDQTVFSLNELTIELEAHRLFSDEIIVSELQINDVYVKIIKQKAGLDQSGVNKDVFSIAGINISNTKTDTDTDIDVNVEEQTDSEGLSDFPFQLIIPQVVISNVTVELVEEGQVHTLKVNDFKIQIAKATPTFQDVDFTLSAQLNGSNVSLAAMTEMDNDIGEINFDIDIADIDIRKFSRFAAPYIAIKNGYFGYKASHSIQLKEGGIHLDIKNLALSTQGVELDRNNIFVGIGEQTFASKKISIEMLHDAELMLEGRGDWEWKDINIFNQTKNQALLAVTQLDLDGIGFQLKEGQYHVDIAKTGISDTFISDNTEDNIPSLALFKQLNINEVALSVSALSVDSVEFSGLKANLQLDKNKQLKNLIINMDDLSDALTGSSDTAQVTASSSEGDVDSQEEQASADSTKPESTFAMKLNRFSLIDSADIQFSDQSVSPNYNRYVHLTELSAGPFNNKIPDQTSVIKLKGKSNQYASFDIAADTKPFLDNPYYHVIADINEMDLPSLTPYVKDALGYEIESGQLDLDVEVKLSGTKIKGDSHILLRGIELSSIDNYEEKESKSQTYIPFNTALGMLKDGDGNVDLDLPLAGDTSSPSFGLSGFMTLLVKRATIIGAREYLTMTLVPYAGLVTVVMAADKHLLKVRINDLAYAPAAIDVSEKDEDFLNKFAELLKDKSELQVKLCGVSTALDIGKEKGAKINNKDDIEALLLISEQRATRFKEYMVEQKGINSSRLLLCKPSLDAGKKAIPHISFET